jgi:hypothetical protein
MRVVVLANADDLTVESLRERVRELAQSDSRFNTSTERRPSGSMVWVIDLVAPSGAGVSWKAVIQALDGKTYEVSFSQANGQVALGTDSKEVVRKVTYESLENSDGVLALDNELALDNDGWALLAPYGEHPKERLVRKDDGTVTREKFLQVFDEKAVDDILANEKGTGLLAKLKRALIRRPIYKGHPDLKLYAPETVTLGNEDMMPMGVIDSNRKTSRGLEIRPQLTPDGAKAVDPDGHKYISGLFLFQRTGRTRDGMIEVRPFKLASVGLTPYPNISGVDSLANAKPNPPESKTKPKEPDMKLIAGWLIANGAVSLANQAEPSEVMVLEACQKLFTSKAADVTALGNEKLTLSGTVTTLTTDRDAQKKRADDAVTALANERKGRAEATVDLVIAQGRLQLAEREAKITALANAADFAAEAKKLTDLPVKYALANAGADGDRKADATKDAATAHSQVLALSNSDARYKDKPFTPELFQQILNDHPAIAEQLRAKPEVVK